LTGLVICAAAYAQNKDSCVTCHAGQSGAYGAPVHEWQTSIHFQNAITCSDCHGGDPHSDDPAVAMDRKKGFLGKPTPTGVPAFCGKCHIAVRANYIQSAHYRALLSSPGGGPNCVTCHTAHAQQKVTLNLINEQTCGACHTYDRAAKLKKTVQGMEDALTSTERRDERMFLEGMDEGRERQTLFSIRNRTHRLTHVLDVARITRELDGIRPDLTTLDAQIRVKERTVADRKRLGTGLMIFFLLSATIAWWAHEELMKPGDGEMPTDE
jgi:hypothetical protein